MNMRTQDQAHLIHVKHEYMVFKSWNWIFVIIGIFSSKNVPKWTAVFVFNVTRQRIQKKRDCNFAHVYLLWAAPKQSGISDLKYIIKYIDDANKHTKRQNLTWEMIYLEN